MKPLVTDLWPQFGEDSTFAASFAQVLVDRQYILSAMGLLAASHPACALRIMKKEIKVDGDPK